MTERQEAAVPADISNSRESEQRRAEAIASFWAIRGKAVRTWIKTDKIGERLIYGVRSDMINGLPR